MMNAKKIEPIHPGEILFEEFLKPMNLSQNRLAMDIRVFEIPTNGFHGTMSSNAFV